MTATIVVILIVLWIGSAIAMAEAFGEAWGLVPIFFPIAALLVFGIYEVKRGRMDWWGNPKPGTPEYEEKKARHRNSIPPTDRQMMFIEDLIEEREVDAEIVVPPSSIQEASWLIDRLKSMPYKDDDDEDGRDDRY